MLNISSTLVGESSPVKEQEDIDDKLPSSIVYNGKEYKRRILESNNIAVVEYSIEAVMMRHLLRPGIISQRRVDENLLVESVKSNLDDAIEDMEEKIKPYISSE
ncbi:MAG: hypothetical protein WD008_03360 [Balneolaceae bacterium]